MTQPETPPARRRYQRTHDEYRWTGAKLRLFLRTLYETVSVGKAAARVGMSRQSAYRLRARHPGVADLWDEGIRLGRERRWLEYQGRRAPRRSGPGTVQGDNGAR